MRTRYTYLGATTVEVVIDGESVEVNLLPPESVELPAAPALLLPPDPALVAAPLEMCAAAPAPTKKERGVMASIRAMWVWVLGLLAALATFAVDTIASLGLPEGSFPVAERWAREVVSLPMYPELTQAQVECVAAEVRQWVKSRGVPHDAGR